MKLDDLGFAESLTKYVIENNLQNFEIGRVVTEHKGSYVVKTENGEFESHITGNLRYSAKGREDFPAVGDWVALKAYDSDLSIIHKILPRSSMISRQAVGQYGEIQIIATNIDYAILIQAADRDFNLNRIERYLSICDTSRIAPIIIITKIDLFTNEEIFEIVQKLSFRFRDLPILTISNETKEGYDKLEEEIKKGKTYCLLGSSGVGKSSLVNNLSEKNLMKTGSISDNTNKGRHITSHRELIILKNGGLLIDNPGMREVGIYDNESGVEKAFDKITELSLNCKFKNCTHSGEKGCAILNSLEKGELDKSSYENYLKIQREKLHFESTVAEKRKKDKEFGKLVKKFKNDKKENKYY